MVYYVYEDTSCSAQLASIHFRAHSSCVATFGESSMACTQTYMGRHDLIFKTTCMDDWTNRTARLALLNSSFGDSAYLAFD